MKTPPTVKELIAELYERFPECPNPPKREWVGLTHKEVNEIEQNGEFWKDHTPLDFANAIEAKLKELNHD